MQLEGSVLLKHSRPQRTASGHASRKQHGMVLLALLLVLVIGASFLLLSKLNAAGRQSYRDQQTAQALAEAKAALIGYAISDPNRPGELPCPDFNDDGKLTLTVDFGGGGACTSYRGWLPWNRLRLPDLRDAAGERLWYGLSIPYRAGDTSPLNSESLGQLTVDGASGVVAVILAPGEAMEGQESRPGTDANSSVGDYLEGLNRGGDQTQYMTAPVGQTFNDRLITITRQELMGIVEKRVLRETRALLNTYYRTNRYYPYANAYSDGSFNCKPNETHGRLPNPGKPFINTISSSCPRLADWPAQGQPRDWFFANRWHLLIHYGVAPACTQPTPNCGGTTYLSAGTLGNVQATVISAGGRLNNTNCNGVPYANQQPRLPTNANLCDYLDSIENTNGNDAYDGPGTPFTASYNDQTVIVAP